MDGYDVIDGEGHTIGHVVEERPDGIVLERGTLRKHRHLLPHTFVEVDADAGVLRTTLSKQLVEDSPEVSDDGDDGQAAAAYYGLASAYEQPDTLGRGVLEPDETAISAEAEAKRHGVETATEQRVRMREGHSDVYGPPGRQIIPPDAHEDVPGRH